MLINSDFYDELPKMRRGSVDMILADLPYGVSQNKWDTKLDLPRMWDLFRHVLKEDGVCVLTAVQPFTTDLIRTNHKGFKYDMVWVKDLKTGHLNSAKMPLRQHEDILVFGGRTYNPQMSEGSQNHSTGVNTVRKSMNNYGMHKLVDNHEVLGNMKHPTSLIEIPAIHPSKKIHPSQKPVELFEYLIRTYSNEGNTVLDPCAGVGTTAIACDICNRKSICIERDPVYFNQIQV